MSSVAGKLNGIVRNTGRVLELCTKLQQENDGLKLENQSLNVALETSLEKNKQLEERLKALTVARTLELTDQENETINEKTLDTKRKINDFVREIDRCIELLR